MAITDAQQAKQIMMKKGGPVTQAGVKNYKPSKMVTVPKVARSSPTHPIAKLAYITDAEKKLLIKKNLHGSLKGKPNRGPGGIPSLQGDFGPGGGGDYSEAGTGRDVGTDDRGRTTIGGDINQGRNVAADRRARAEQINRSREAAARREAARKREIARKATETFNQREKERKAKQKKTTALKDLDIIPGLFEDDEEDIGFDEADTNKDGKVGPIERLNAFTNRKNVELANKRALQKFQDIEQYVSPIDEYGLSAEELAEKVAADPTYGYDFSDLETGKSQLGSNIGTSIESYRPNLYDVNSPAPGLIGAIINKIRPDTQVTALNTLKKARDYRDLAATGKVTQDDLRELRNRGRTDDQIKFLEVGGRDSDPYIPPIIQPDEDKKEDKDDEDPFQLALAFRKDGGRVPYADGGIMDLESARQMLFLGGIAKSIGKAVKGATRAVKKIVKSPVGKIGLAAFLGPKIFAGMGGTGGFGGLGSLFSKGKGLFDLAKANPLVTSLAGGALAGLLQSKGLKDENEDGLDDETGLDIEAILADPYGKGGLRGRFDYGSGLKDGGMPAEKGMMNLQGMEMDFREEGGFVPIGKKERADDVPARLSKNEFVMTADAVRGAGDGDIDKGAEKMYNLMDKLEAENDQSQGLDGARKMFKTAQRLEEVL